MQISPVTRERPRARAAPCSESLSAFGWRERFEALVDALFGFELRAEELKQLLAPGTPRPDVRTSCGLPRVTDPTSAEEVAAVQLDCS